MPKTATPEKFGFLPPPELLARLAAWKPGTTDISEQANRDRAAWAEAPLRYFAHLTGLDYEADQPATALRDLLGDLMHLCDVLEIDFDGELDVARGHYNAEISEESEAS